MGNASVTQRLLLLVKAVNNPSDCNDVVVDGVITNWWDVAAEAIAAAEAEIAERAMPVDASWLNTLSWTNLLSNLWELVITNEPTGSTVFFAVAMFDDGRFVASLNNGRAIEIKCRGQVLDLLAALKGTE